MKTKLECPVPLPRRSSDQDTEAIRWFCNGRHANFFAHMEKRHHGEIVEYLSYRLKISRDDAEDCYASAVEAAFKKASIPNGNLQNPIGYIFNAAYFSAVDLLQTVHRRAVSSVQPDQTRHDPDEFDISAGGEQLPDEDAADQCSFEVSDRLSDSAALAIVEDIEPDVEIEEGWATVLVKEAISYLSNAERRVIDTLLSHAEFNFGENQHLFSSADAPAALGMQPAAFRKAKSRAFERLRKLIPQIINDLGIDLPIRVEESIFTASWPGPSDDGEE